MAGKPTYEELEQRVKELEDQVVEGKLTQEALRESEQLLNDVFNSIQDGISVLNTDLTIRSVNGVMKKWYAKNLPLEGKKCHVCYHDSDKPCNPCPTIRCVESGQTEREIVPGLPGSPVEWIELFSYPMKDQRTGEVTGVVEFVRDITERIRAEEAQRESETKYSTLVESSKDGIIMISDGMLSFVNKASIELVGYAPEEMIGVNFLNFVATDYRELVLKRYADRMEGKDVPAIYEIELLRRDGKTIPVELNAIRIDFKDKLADLVLIRDITDRKQAEEALRESETKFRSLFNLSPQAIALTEIEQGRLVNVNDKLCELTQYTKEEIIYFTTTEVGLYTEKDRSRFITELKRYGEVNGLEMDFMAKDGSILNTLMFARIIQIAGEPFILTIFFDLTEQKRLQAQLQQAQKMETLGLLAGGVAHDLNNVLSGIVSYPELLLLDLPEDSKLRKPIETMQDSGHKAAAIVQDLLTVARGVATTKAPLNLNDLLSDYLNSPEFKKLVQFHPTVTIKSNLNSNLLNITGSHVHIRKVIMNLVSNASEAIEGSGNVIISTMNRYIDRPFRGYDDVSIGEYAVLAVSDDGSGISSGDLERIFDPFYTKKVLGRSGTGLGLAVVWNVVQDHEGYIDVKSDENGTTFELYFPITREEISGQDLSIHIKDYKGNGEKILVVDDVESQREIACEMLNTLDYKAKAVSSGEEAVEYLKEHSVDLIFLDMIMDPGINGRETYERIIKIHPNQKAVIASGFAETDDVKEAQRLGAGQYIKKPLTLEKMGIAVRDELKK